MDSQDSSEKDESEMDIEPLTQKNEKKISLNDQFESLASKLVTGGTRKPEINAHIDPRNQAIFYPQNLELVSHQTFKHFMQKNRFEKSRKDVFQVIREWLESKKIQAPNRVVEKLEKQVMVVRCVSRYEFSNDVMIVEDETGREKMQIRKNILWVGMICCVETTWENSMYKLNRIIDLSQPIPSLPERIYLPLSAYRILLLKAPFSKNDSEQQLGVQLLLFQLAKLKNKQRTEVNCVILMGPFLSIENYFVKEGNLKKSYDEEFTDLIESLYVNILTVCPSAQLVIVPSPNEVTSFYPFPQPPLKCAFRAPKLSFLSNPGSLVLSNGDKSYKLDIINSDLLTYIDENKVGSPTMDLLQQNLDTYFKQPFPMSNTIHSPIDQLNLGRLFNEGKFGDVVIMSSQDSPPFTRQVKGRVFMNIGSLGMDYHMAQKHFMSLLSIYGGEGGAARTVKVQTIALG